MQNNGFTGVFLRTENITIWPFQSRRSVHVINCEVKKLEQFLMKIDYPCGESRTLSKNKFLKE